MTRQAIGTLGRSLLLPPLLVMAVAALLLIGLHAQPADPPAAKERVGIITTVADSKLCDRQPGGGEGSDHFCIDPVGGMAVARDGTLYFGGQNRIRKITREGIIVTIAGNGEQVPSGDGGPAARATLCGPSAIELASDGSLYFADYTNNQVRKIDTEGNVTAVAGSGERGYSGDGGPATLAQLNSPSDLAIGPDGSLYIADVGNNRVRKVSRDGVITTVAGDGQSGYSGDGGPPTRARLWLPMGVAAGPQGALYIADMGNSRIRKVSAGMIVTVAGDGKQEPFAEGMAATDLGLSAPRRIAVGPDGNLYIADEGHFRILRIDRRGTVMAVAGNGENRYSGDGGPATKAGLEWPFDFVVAPDGSIYITDVMSNRIRKVTWKQKSRD